MIIGVNSATMPARSWSTGASPRARDFASRAPKTLTVMAIIGYTQGVAAVSRPAAERPQAAEDGPLGDQPGEQIGLVRGERGGGHDQHSERGDERRASQGAAEPGHRARVGAEIGVHGDGRVPRAGIAAGDAALAPRPGA